MFSNVDPRAALSSGRAAHAAARLARPVETSSPSSLNVHGTTVTARAVLTRQLGALASDGRTFHGLMQRVYGPGYDRGAAESIRQRSASGDFSWLPSVKFVPEANLGGALGAYDAAGDTVFLSDSLIGEPARAASVLTEEVGHALDARLNTTDAPGDEGELFRRILSGESLSRRQVAAIRRDDDKGTIQVGGRPVEVEFFFKKIKKLFKKGTKAIGHVAKKAFGVARNIGQGALDVAKQTAQLVGRGIRKAGALAGPVLPFGNVVHKAADFIGGLLGAKGPASSPRPTEAIAASPTNVIDLTPSMFEGLPIGTARALADDAGYTVQLVQHGCHGPHDTNPSRFTLFVQAGEVTGATRG